MYAHRATARRATVFLILAMLVTLPACNAITGIDDYGTQSATSAPAADAVDSGSADSGATSETLAPIDTGSPPVDSGVESTPTDTIITSDTAPPPDTTAPSDASPDACITHRNGVADSAGSWSTYNFCAPLGTPGNGSTYSLAMAEAARDSLGASTPGGAGTVCGSSLVLACVKTVFGYVSWGYAGPLAGYMYVNASSCTACPTTLCPTWD